MNRAAQKHFGIAASASLVCMGCATRALKALPSQAARPPAVQQPAVSAKVTVGQVAAPAALQLTINWPKRDRPHFQAATIPTSTNTLEIAVSEGIAVVATRTVTRPSGNSPTAVEFTLPAGNNVSIQVKAYRDATVTANSLVIASGATSGLNLASSTTTVASVNLDATYIPTVSKLSTNVGQSGDSVTFSVANLSPGLATTTPTVVFNDATASAVTMSGTSVTAVVPPDAVTGPVRVVSDGVTSTSQAYFWVPVSLDLTATKATWDGSAAGSAIAIIGGAPLPLCVTPHFAAAPNDDLSAYGQPPAATLTNTVSAVVGFSPDGSSFIATGDVNKSTTVEASVGSKTSSPIQVTAEDVQVSLSPATASTGGAGAPNVSLVAFNLLSDGSTNSAVTLSSSDEASLSLSAANVAQPIGNVWTGPVTVTATSQLNSARQAQATITLDQYVCATLAGGGNGSNGIDGTGNQAQFGQLSDVALAPDANSCYVTDTIGNFGLLRHIFSSGNAYQTATLVDSQLTGVFDFGAVTQALSLTYSGNTESVNGALAIDAAGDIYYGTGGVNELVPNPGSYSRKFIAGGVEGARGFANGPGETASFQSIAGLAFDNRTGNLYVADSENNAIRKIAYDGTVSTVAGGFSQPQGVAVDHEGNIYVADTGNDRICKIALSEAFGSGATIFLPVSTVAGIAGNAGHADGSADPAALNRATFNQPTRIAIDRAGDLFVSDQGSGLVRRIRPDGSVVTIAGGGAGAVPRDGVGSNVVFAAALGSGSFTRPLLLTCDATGDVIIADYNLVRVLVPSN